ncbi:hypothetical protein ACVDG9_24665 [Roseibium sp. RP-7]
MARALQIYLGRKSEDVGRELLHLCDTGEHMGDPEDDEDLEY